MAFLGCDKADDIQEMRPTARPVMFDFSLEGENSERGSLTRTDYLSSSKKVYVSIDEGATYYEYGYNSTSGLWEAERKYNSETSAWESTDGITWSSSSMLFYAIVRNDDTPMTQGATISLMGEQTTLANLNASDFYGVVTQVSYTTGKVSLTLKHQVARLKISVTNCASPAGMTCTSNATLTTSGTITTGSDKISVTSLGTEQTIKFYLQEYDTSAKTAVFVANILPRGGLTGSFTLTTSAGNQYTVTIATSGGITLDPGRTTIMNVKLPN